MSAFVRYLPAAAELLPWLLNLATWLLARSLNMPEPLVHATGLFVFVQVQAFENSFSRRCARSVSCAVLACRSRGDPQPSEGEPAMIRPRCSCAAPCSPTPSSAASRPS